jgi:hypothetical protein
MKSKVNTIFALIAIVGLSAFTNGVKPVTYTVDAAKSTITWAA